MCVGWGGGWGWGWGGGVGGRAGGGPGGSCSLPSTGKLSPLAGELHQDLGHQCPRLHHWNLAVPASGGTSVLVKRAVLDRGAKPARLEAPTGRQTRDVLPAALILPNAVGPPIPRPQPRTHRSITSATRRVSRLPMRPAGWFIAY